MNYTWVLCCKLLNSLNQVAESYLNYIYFLKTIFIYIETHVLDNRLKNVCRIKVAQCFTENPLFGKVSAYH